jgi:GT2 family glycosyltransferase
MDNEPKVSLVTPFYNIHEFLAEAIESVLAQNYKNFETCNNQSTEGSRSALSISLIERLGIPRPGGAFRAGEETDLAIRALVVAGYKVVNAPEMPSSTSGVGRARKPRK